MKATINYRCSQADLYVACRYGWLLCRKNLAGFSAVKSKYTEEFIEEQILAIETADSLPNKDTRYESYDVNKQKYDLCLSMLIHKFDILLSYVDDAFPTTEHEIMYRSCGEPYKTKAEKGHWVSVLALMNAAVSFMENHVAELETTPDNPSVKNNMPADFIDQFKSLRTEMTTLNDACVASNGQGQQNTLAKINANNAIYDALIKMCSDGIRIFKNDPMVAEMFSFADILKKTRGNRPAGIYGKITDKVTGKVIEGASVTVKDTTKTAVADKMGNFEVSPMAAGKYVALIEMLGYQPFESEEITVKVDKFTRLNVALALAPVAVSA